MTTGTFVLCAIRLVKFTPANKFAKKESLLEKTQMKGRKKKNQNFVTLNEMISKGKKNLHETKR